MYHDPELMLTLAHDHHRELIAEADRKRLFARIARRRREHGGAHTRSPRAPTQ